MSAMRRLLVLLLGAALALSLTACSSFALPGAGDLLRAPALGQGQGKLQEALTEYLREEPEYKYPMEGEWRSPLLVEDIDGDGSEEGVLLYSMAGSGTAGVGSNVHIALLEQVDGVWTVAQDIEGANTEVASFEAVDLQGDGTLQLIVGFTSAGTAQGAANSLAVYRYDRNGLQALYTTPYSRYAVGDFTGEERPGLAVVYADDGLNFWCAFMEGGELVPKTPTIKLHPSFVNCVGINPSQNQAGVPMVVLDGMAETNMLASEVLVYSGEHFYKFQEAQNLVFEESGRQNPLLTARDIDGDGGVEIPVRDVLITTPKDDKKLETVLWMDFLEDTPEEKQFGIVDSSKSVFIRLPMEWRSNVRVDDGDGAGEWVIEHRQTRAELLRMRVPTSGVTPPVGSITVSLISGAYLDVSSRLPADEREMIDVVPLI